MPEALWHNTHMPQLAPVLETDEYIEQAYFFHAFRLRQQDGRPAQEILARIHEEILAITRLPMAIQFMSTELRHTGLLSTAAQRLTHYFTPFQGFILAKAEEEGMRFSMETALEVLEHEAQYRSQAPTPQGLFVYQFEVLCRNRLGYDHGLDAMMLDGFYDADWREYLEVVRRNIGEVEFADLVYLRSEVYELEHRAKESALALPRVLFGEKEGKIARANRGRDPLYLFAALQRHLNYPRVPYLRKKDDPLQQLPMVLVKLREVEQRVKQLENEARDRLRFAPKSVDEVKPIPLDEEL
jgi:hypothetical protein